MDLASHVASPDEQEPLLAIPRRIEQSYTEPHSEVSDTLDENGPPKPDDNSRRSIGWTSAYILIVSRILGSGIFATPGIITKSVGSIGLSLTLWILGAVIAACGFAISAEFGCMLPRSGGDKVYLEYAYRRPKFLASTLIAVQAVFLGFTASNCIIFGNYILYAFSVEPTPLYRKGLAVGLLTAVTVVHGCFLNTGIRIQNTLGWTKIGLIVFMIFTGLVVLTTSRGDDTAAAKDLSWERIWRDSEWGWGSIGPSVFKVIYSYSGFANVNNVLGEVKNPVRTLKTAGPAALLTVCLLYLLINVAYFITIPIEDIKGSKELIAALFFEKVYGNQFGRVVLPLSIAISAAGNVMVVTFAMSRVNQEIARQGFLPFGKILGSSKPFNTPLGGLLVHYIPSILVITLPPSEDIYSFILDIEGYPSQFFALAVAVGLLKLRKTEPDLKRPYRAWLPAVWIRIALALALATAPFVPPKSGNGDVKFWYATYAVIGIGIFVVAVIYWYIWTIALPHWRGYELVETSEVSDDGFVVKRLVKVKPSAAVPEDRL